MTLTVKTLALGILALALGGVAACAPEKPAAPTYEKDVGPILDAHCARCHNSRGPDGGFLGEADASTKSPTPQVCRFDSYAGAKPPCAQLMQPYINQGPGSDPMPPPPATKLNDWEIDVLVRWGNNGAPER